MASVYLAQLSGSAGFAKWIALKTIHPHIANDRRFVNMFLDEARLASRLDHPNLCSVFDFGEEHGTWFIAMEYLHGETFGVVARTGWSNHHPPPYLMVARILADAARGLHAAHELRLPSGENAGVVHRDVSPENIFVTYAGPTKIVDFGVARSKSQSQDLTVAGELKGKIAYMCPEQLREEPVDRRADIWSLGVVLWEVTVGRRLFRRKTDAGTVYAVLHDDVPRPVRFRSDYPPTLAAIVLKALDRNRDGRYHTALDFARALEQWLATTGMPTGAGEVSEYMHSLFAEQIAVRDRLLRTTHPEAPMEEATLLNTERFLPRALHPETSPGPDTDTPIPLLTARTHRPLQLGPSSLNSASHRGYQSSLLPAWRRRGVPSLVGGGLLILVSFLVVAYWLSQRPPTEVPPTTFVPRRLSSRVLSLPSQKVQVNVQSGVGSVVEKRWEPPPPR